MGACWFWLPYSFLLVMYAMYYCCTSRILHKITPPCDTILGNWELFVTEGVVLWRYLRRPYQLIRVLCHDLGSCCCRRLRMKTRSGHSPQLTPGATIILSTTRRLMFRRLIIFTQFRRIKKDQYPRKPTNATKGAQKSKVPARQQSCKY